MSSLRWEQHQGDEQLMGCYHRNYNTFSFTVVLSPSLSTSLPLTLSLSTFVLHVLSAIPLLLIVRTLTRLQHRRLSSWSNVTAPANADIPKLFHFFSSSHFPPPFFFLFISLLSVLSATVFLSVLSLCVLPALAWLRLRLWSLLSALMSAFLNGSVRAAADLEDWGHCSVTLLQGAVSLSLSFPPFYKFLPLSPFNSLFLSQFLTYSFSVSPT